MPRGSGKNFGAPEGNPAGFIANAIRSGLSQRGGLSGFREAGGRIDNNLWGKLWGEVSASLGRSGDIAGLDPNLPPDPGMFTDSHWGREGSYMYRVDILVRPTGGDEYEPRAFWYTSDEVVSPWRAVEIGVDLYDAATDAGGSFEGEVVGGGVLVGLNRMGVR